METSISKIESIKKLVFARADELHAKGDLEGLRKFWKAKATKWDYYSLLDARSELPRDFAIEMGNALREEMDYIEELGKDLRYQLDAMADNHWANPMQLTLEV